MIEDLTKFRTIKAMNDGGSKKPPSSTVLTGSGPRKHNPHIRIERIEYLLREAFKELSLLKSEVKRDG